ncbi:hypothetical protein CVT26_007563 [Gymnopilus dilepis]|uniref:Uncharacterized protein n=1 Tax=Gymnopilus dilepis TaxID=231916 RepID=A0A409XAR6_9AGAR|nr:hypothetical protein CVT26_007563 [Gymnopilus dilepis]
MSTSASQSVVPKGVWGYLLPAKRISLERIFVPASEGLSPPFDLNGLDLSRWHRPTFSNRQRVTCLDDYRFTAKAFPFDSKVKLFEPFTVLWGKDDIANVSVNSFSGGTLRASAGDIIIVKHGFDGSLIDVPREDEHLVLRVVLQYVFFALSDICTMLTLSSLIEMKIVM